VVLVGLAAKPVPMLPLQVVRRGLSLVGSLIYDHPQDFVQTIELVRSGRVRPSALAAHVYPLDEAAAALERVATGGTGKTLLDIGGVLSAEPDESPATATRHPT
jgi:threonine dehydrogenase-like Zn-dependent dehydrogenase